jgi:hypothetical protein
MALVPLVIQAHSETKINMESTGEDWIIGMRDIIKGFINRLVEPVDRVILNIRDNVVDFIPINSDGNIYLDPNLLQMLLEHVQVEEILGYRLLSDDLLCWHALDDLDRTHAKIWNGLVIGHIEHFDTLTTESIAEKTRKLRADGFVPFLWSTSRGQAFISDLLAELATLWDFEVVNNYGNLYILWCNVNKWIVDEPLGSWICRTLSNIAMGGLPIVTLSGDWVQTMDNNLSTRVRLTYAAQRALQDLSHPLEYPPLRVNEDLSITAELGSIDEIEKLRQSMLRYLHFEGQWFVKPISLSVEDEVVLLNKITSHLPQYTPLIITVDEDKFLVVDVNNKPAQDNPFGEYHEGWNLLQKLSEITQLDREQYSFAPKELGVISMSISDPKIEITDTDVELVYSDGTRRDLVDSDVDNLEQQWISGSLLSLWAKVLLTKRGIVSKQPL